MKKYALALAFVLVSTPALAFDWSNPSTMFVDSTKLVPSGGTTNQVLAKASNTDNDTHWISAGAAAIPLSYLDVDGTLAADSDVKVASQKATKTYVDTSVAGITAPIPLSYLDTDGTLAADSDTKVASQKATKTYVDTTFAAAMPFSYLDIDVTLAADSDTRVASQHATKTYVDTAIAGIPTGSTTIAALTDVVVGTITGSYLLTDDWVAADNFAGLGDTAVGRNAGAGMTNNAATVDDSFFGYRAGLSNTTGTGNTFMGARAGAAVTSGSENTAFGVEACTGGSGAKHSNVGVGFQVECGTGTSQLNTIVGYQATVRDSASGNDVNNVAIGAGATVSNSLQSASHQTAIGANSFVTRENSMAIGYGAAATNNDAIMIGADNNNHANSWKIGAPADVQRITEGANRPMIHATLSAGSVVVNNNLVSATSEIFCTEQTAGGVPGAIGISARSAGTSFTITSTSGADTSEVACEIKEPM